MRREAVAAGRFYPASASQLEAMIEAMVDERLAFGQEIANQVK